MSHKKRHKVQNKSTVLLEMFVVKIFSWGRRTTKIIHTTIYVRYTLCVFNYRGLPPTTKIFQHEILDKNISCEIFPNYGMKNKCRCSLSKLENLLELIFANRTQGETACETLLLLAFILAAVTTTCKTLLILSNRIMAYFSFREICDQCLDKGGGRRRGADLWEATARAQRNWSVLTKLGLVAKVISKMNF